MRDAERVAGPCKGRRRSNARSWKTLDYRMWRCRRRVSWVRYGVELRSRARTAHAPAQRARALKSRYPYPFGTPLRMQVYTLGRVRTGLQAVRSLGLDWIGCCAHAVIVVPVSLPLMQAIGSLTRPCATFHLGLLPLEDVAVKTLGRLLFLASRTYCPFYPTPLAASWPPVHAHSAPTGLATLLSLSCCRELSSYPYPVSLPPSLAYACLHNTPHPHLIHLAFVSQDTSPRLHSRLGLHMVLESRCSARKSRQGPSHLHLHFTPSTSHPRIIAHGLDGHLHSSWLAFALFRVAIIP